jgi:hypothetical protein
MLALVDGAAAAGQHGHWVGLDPAEQHGADAWPRSEMSEKPS